MTWLLAFKIFMGFIVIILVILTLVVAYVSTFEDEED